MEVAKTHGNRVSATLMHMDPEVYAFFFQIYTTVGQQRKL